VAFVCVFAGGPGWWIVDLFGWRGLGVWATVILPRRRRRLDVSLFPSQGLTQHASDQAFTVARSHDPPGQRSPFRTHIAGKKAAQPQHALPLAFGAQFCF